jgi:hypothetical protein
VTQETAVTQSNVFAFKNSELETLLFADVGTEANGSGLTVLSMLARLGLDPWAEAARWIDLPKTVAIDCLAGAIARMPLGPQALTEARATAKRLILLLPLRNTIREQAAASVGSPDIQAMPKWLPMALLYGVLAVGMGANAFFASRATNAAPVKTDVTTEQPAKPPATEQPVVPQNN